MKNFCRAMAVILGFLLFVATILIGSLQLVVYNYAVYIACLCFIAGIMLIYFIVNNNKEVDGKTPIIWWISGILFCVAYSILIPIRILWLSELPWLNNVAVASVIVAGLIWVIGKAIPRM